MKVAPSGRQVEIAFGAQRATVVGVGGGLRTYAIGGEHVLDGYRADEMCPSGRGQALLPWPNRIADGTYQFDGATYELALTEPARHNAIHGLTRFAAWQVDEIEPDRVLLTHRLYPQPGYPFVVDLLVRYRLGPDGLSVVCGATNSGRERCPFGAGAHPYVRIGDAPVDDMLLRSAAATYAESDDRGIPTASRPVAGTPYDFREPRPIGALKLDTAFTDLERDGHGRATVELSEIDGPRRITVWTGPEWTDLMLYTGDTLGDAGRRRRSLAVEPMTCPPNAFRSGERLITLEPGESFEAAWGIEADGF